MLSVVSLLLTTLNLRCARLQLARLFILLVFSVSLLIGVPVWWMTTNVYRSTIPDITLATSQVVRLKRHIFYDEDIPYASRFLTPLLVLLSLKLLD